MIAQETTGEVFYLSSDHGGSISGGFCQSCKKHHVVMTDPHPTCCPHCQHNTLRHQIGKTKVIFKGNGWSKPEPEYPLG